MLLSTGGCGASGGDESAVPGANGTAGAGQGGTATLLFWQAPTIMNPYLTGSTKEVLAASLVLEPLAEYDENGELVPALASEIPTVENGLVDADRTAITWPLRPGVVWSDGAPFTANDVVFTWRYCTAPGGGCALASSFEGVANVAAVDDLTVRVTFDGPKPYPYVPFVASTSPIIQEAQFAACLGAAAVECTADNFAPIGTGPYTVADFRTNDTALLAFNSEYRGVDDGQPFFGEVVVKGGGDAAAAARSVLQLGEAGYAWNLQVEPEILASMEAAGRGTVVSAYGVSVEHLMLNQTNPDAAVGERRSEFGDGRNPHPFLTDPAIGRALSLAIDRETLVAVGYGENGGRPTCDIWPMSVDPFECPAQNLDGAKRLLDDAGIVDSDGDGIREYAGVPLEVLFQTSTNTVRQTAQELIKSWWTDLGIETELKNVDSSVYFGDDPSSPDTTGKFYADVQMYTMTSPGPDPEWYLGSWVSSAIPRRANGYIGMNAPRHHSDEYDALYAELQRTADPDRREELTAALNDLLVGSYAVIPLIHRGEVSAHAADIQGMRMNGWDSELWNFEEWTRQ
jgi:peptide/nickel transport system substrate-binding protein